MEIKLKNVTDGDVIPSFLVIIEGEIINSCCENEEVDHDDFVYIWTKKPDVALPWPVLKKHFKAVVQLTVGENNLGLQYRDCCRFIKLIHEPVQSNHFVRLLYVIASDDEYQGCIQGPHQETAGHSVYAEEYGAVAASHRIILGVKLIQAFIAESLHRHGLSRRTFRLETNSATRDDEPVCHIFRLHSLTTQQASQLSDKALWQRVRDELAVCEELPNMNLCKFLAFVSFTRYQNSSRVWPTTHEQMLELTNGHAALGGGGLALIGTGCLHTWAKNLAELVQCFTNCQKIDRMVLLDDSRYRETYWACYSTTLGATCHELGHTFDLGHSECGMMGGQFGDIHLAFVLPQMLDDTAPFYNSWTSPSQKQLLMETSRNPGIPDQQKCTLHRSWTNAIRWKKWLTKDWEMADWNRAEALWLYYHKWFSAPHPNNSRHGPQLYGLEIRARHSLRIVIVYVFDDNRNERAPVLRRYWEFTNTIGRLTFRINIEELKPLQDSDSMRILAEDTMGNTMIKTLSLVNLFEQNSIGNQEMHQEDRDHTLLQQNFECDN